LIAGTGVAAVGAWFMTKNRHVDIFRSAVKAGAVVTLVAAAAVSITGDLDSKIMVEQQPMKMAAAEGLYETTANAPFSILTIGDISGDTATPIIEVPGLLSFLSTGDFNGTVQGINNLQAAYENQYGPGNYVPYVPVSYWSFRLMIGLGMLGVLWAVWALWRYRGGRNPQKGKLFHYSTLFVFFGPLLAASFGWIFTEMGRQPWIVFGEQLTADGVSPLTTVTEVWISLIGFTLVYAILAVIEIKLLLKYIKAGPPDEIIADPYEDSKKSDDNQLYFAY
jgi:cytochrome d ubiquinol oxidase subunit I